MTHQLQWQKFPVLDQGYICLVDVMGDDAAIVQAARVSYGKDEQGRSEDEWCELCHNTQEIITDKNGKEWPGDANVEPAGGGSIHQCTCVNILPKVDRQLIRYLMNHSHTTPFEMVEIKFMVQVPMDAWRQWVRHRTANINEYSTRYTEALDFMQQTDAAGWRLQAVDNKQGSSGFLEEWPDKLKELPNDPHLLFLNGNIISSSLGLKPGEYLSDKEKQLSNMTWDFYQMNVFLEKWQKKTNNEENLFASADVAYREILKLSITIQQDSGFESLKTHVTEKDFNRIIKAYNKDRDKEKRVFGTENWTIHHRQNLITALKLELFA